LVCQALFAACGRYSALIESECFSSSLFSSRYEY
jgi:hypothetical protein